MKAQGKPIEFICKIQFFENKSQSIKEKVFEGGNAHEKAVIWGKKTLENFNFDLIQTSIKTI